MAHLIVLRYSTSFTAGKDLVHGGHEEIEKQIANRKYPMKLERDGYCVPDAWEWKMMEYRVKQEVLPDFAADFGAINLNPENNKTSLWQIFRAKPHNKNCDPKDRIPQRTILLIRWVFKWLNRLGISPYHPCAVSDKVPEGFTKDYPAYHIILGQRYDPVEKTTYNGDHSDTL